MALSIVYVQIPLLVLIKEANNEAIKCFSQGKMVNCESLKRFPISTADSGSSSSVQAAMRAFTFIVSTPPISLLRNVNDTPLFHWGQFRQKNRHLSAE